MKISDSKTTLTKDELALNDMFEKLTADFSKSKAKPTLDGVTPSSDNKQDYLINTFTKTSKLLTGVQSIIEDKNSQSIEDYLTKNLPQKKYKATCHTWFIVKDKNVNINWRKPLIQSSTITTDVIVDELPFSEGAMRYAFYMYDITLNQALIGKLPKKIKNDQNNLDFFSKDIESVIICQHLVNSFNERIVEFLPSSDLILNFVHTFVYNIKIGGRTKLLYWTENLIKGKYEKYNNNDGWVKNGGNESGKVAQAFSHFSWQITKGYMMIVDLQGVGGILTDPQIHCLDKSKFGQGNLGYFGIIKFFLSHRCNKYCNDLGLVHPKKAVKIDEKFNFFVDNYELPDQKYRVINKLCDLCRNSFKMSAIDVYYKKVQCKENYCDDCSYQMKSTMKRGYCIDCNASFNSSIYWFNMKRTDFPVRCGPCRKTNRDKMRKDLVQLNETNTLQNSNNVNCLIEEDINLISSNEVLITPKNITQECKETKDSKVIDINAIDSKIANDSKVVDINAFDTKSNLVDNTNNGKKVIAETKKEEKTVPKKVNKPKCLKDLFP